MTVLTLSVIATVARAADCQSGDQFAAVASLVSDTVGETLLVHEGCFAEDTATIENAEALTITCATSGCALPPLVLRRSGVSISEATFTSAATISVGPGHITVASGVKTAAAIYAEDCDLTVSATAFTRVGTSGTAIFGPDSNLDIADSSFTQVFGMGVEAATDQADITVSVRGSTFDDVGTAGIDANDRLPGASGTITQLDVTDVVFLNQSTSFGDIYGAATEFNHTRTTHTGSTSGLTGVVTVTADRTSVTDAVFDGTSAENGSGTLFLLGGSSVRIKGGEFRPSGSSDYALKVHGAAETEIVGGMWDPPAPMTIVADKVSITGVRYRLAEHDKDTSVLTTEDAEVIFVQNTVCADGRLEAVTQGLLDAPGSDLKMTANVFQHIVLANGPLISTAAEGRATSPASVLLHDNTFADVMATSLLAGAVDELDFKNNLVYQSIPRVDLRERPTTLDVGYNSGMRRTSAGCFRKAGGMATS